MPRKNYHSRIEPVRWVNTYEPGGDRYSVGVDNEGREVTPHFPPIHRTKQEEDALMSRTLNSTSLGGRGEYE